jgi:DNA-binding SARP family transcriptional activator
VSGLRFRVLGPVEMLRDEKPVPLGARTTLTIVAALLMSPNRFVPVSALVDWIWDHRPPKHPQAALHNALSRLRHLSGEADFIETLPGGYRLNINSGQHDLLRFDELLATARDAKACDHLVGAAEALDEALSLWDEPLLGNVESEIFRNEAVQQLTERYLETTEERAAIYLNLGRPRDVVADLSRMARAHPYRETITAQLMIALQGSGRQADALAAYRKLQTVLRDDLGIDPSPRLQDLHVRVLRGERLTLQGAYS